MKIKFSPSTNILRDSEKELNYIVTPNSKEVFNNLINNLKSGNKVFNLIGSYGTGKSTFLWAFQQNLLNKKDHFIKLNGQFNGLQKFEFIKLIGDNKSLSDSLSHSLKNKKQENPHEVALEMLDDFYEKSCRKKGKFLIIFIDEFGKFLEFAAKDNPERELYFIQQLAEYVNDHKKNVLLISTLHQGFSSYAKQLNKEQRNEWEKVKGRIKEISFNEPVEQLVKLSASFISENYNYKVDSKKLNSINKIIDKSKLSLVSEIDNDLLKNIYPLDMLSVSVLVQTLQRYGQNERSLFSFLSSSDPYGLSSFDLQKDEFFNVESVYNYLNHNFFSFINSKFNPDFSKWSNLKSLIERIQGIFTSDIEDRIRIIKVIGLLNIFGSKKAINNKSFLSNYLQNVLGINNAENLISELEKKQLIRYATYANQYILFGGTDLDIDIALIDAENRIDLSLDLSSTINKYVDMPVMSAKRYMLDKGTSRFFSFSISEEIQDEYQKDYDGLINIILGKKVKKKDLLTDDAVLFCNISNITELKLSVDEIRKIEYVIKENTNDKVAISELERLRESEANKIRRIILSDIYSEDVNWYFNAQKIRIDSLKNLNSKLSDISDLIYSKTPVFHNELINKNKLSGSISLARRNLFTRLVENINEIDLGYPKDKFPPDKTIFLTLLKETGIHSLKDKKFQIGNVNSDIADLWKVSNDFIDSASKQTKNLVEFIDVLRFKPFAIKQGLIDCWVGIFLLLKSDEFALYYKGQYVAELNKDNLELIYKSPKDFTIKSYDISGNKLLLFNRYRDLTQLNVVSEANTTSFIQTIRPFLILARQLEEVTKKTKNFKDKRTLELRESIVNATDPEKLFFEDFPAVYSIFNISELSDDDMLKYINDLAFSIKELTSYYQKLVDNTYHKFEVIFGKHVDFKKFKTTVNKRYSSLKPDLLPSHIKTFFNRVSSALDDKESWINSVVQDLVGSTLQNITDTDLEKLDNRLIKSFLELDHLVDLHKVELNKDQEVYRIEVTTTKGGDIPQQFIIDEKDNVKVDLLADQLEKVLSSDSNINKIAIINLLKRLKNE